MFSASESRIQLMAEEDGNMPEKAFTNMTTPADNHSARPLKTYEKNNIPVSAPDENPSPEICNPCKERSSDNNTDCPSAEVEMEVAGNEPTSYSWNLRYGSMMSLYKVCRCVLKAALSAISIRNNTVKEEEEEEEKMEEEEVEEEEEDDEEYQDMEEGEFEEEKEKEKEEEEEDNEDDDEYKDMEEGEYEEEDDDDDDDDDDKYKDVEEGEYEEEYYEEEEYMEEVEYEDQYSEEECIICVLLRVINMFVNAGRTLP